MKLDYSKLPFDANGNAEAPELFLKTLSGDTICPVFGAHNIKMNIRLAEVSEIEFDVPAVLEDGAANPCYGKLTGYKQIYTGQYGVYVTEKPKKSSDGIAEVKHVTAYSVEKLLENKNFFLEEGVYKFCNTANVSDPSTIIGRILETDPTWNIGYVPNAIANKYGAFDGYDGKLLSFLQNDAAQKFRCVFVFDPYGSEEKPGKTIEILDADAERSTLPIYLDFDNLLLSTDVEEVTDELVTAIRPYGADELSIHEVNPTGDDWVYNLSGFIARGDLGDPEDKSSLAGKFLAWQALVQSKRSLYCALTAARASAWAQYYTVLAQRDAKQLELDGALVAQNAAIQGGDAKGLGTAKAKVDKLKDAVDEKEKEIEALDGRIKNLNASIAAVASPLSLRKAFTEDEYKRLLPYVIQQDVTDDTFIASDVAADMTPSIAGAAVNKSGVAIAGAQIEGQTLNASSVSGLALSCTMYTIIGGGLSVGSLKADILRGTLETESGNKFTLSLYVGKVTNGVTTAENGIVTMSGTYTGNVSANSTSGEISFTTNQAALYLTASAGEFQRWAVEQQLYDYAVDLLNDYAVPTYQFEVDSGNFLFAREFAPFRNKLTLGDGVYLNLPGEQTITPYLIEIGLDFEDRSALALTFSNRFKRRDNVTTLKDIIEKTYLSGKSFDLAKHAYNTAASEATDAARFIKSSLDFAANRIKSADNQSVVIDRAGIRIGEELRDANGKLTHKQREMRLVNDMLAITDDGWATSKLAIGYFKPNGTSDYFGVNAEVIAGNLLVGSELKITASDGENKTFFTVDGSGVRIDADSFLITHGESGEGFDSVLNGVKSDALSAAQHDLFKALVPTGSLGDNATVFYADSAPTEAKSGDYWYLTKDGVRVGTATYNAGTVFKRENNSWTPANSDLRKALDNAKAAQDTADGKVMFFRADANAQKVNGTVSPPTAKVANTSSPWCGFDPAHATGDLWFCTKAATVSGVAYKKDKLYRCKSEAKTGGGYTVTWEEVTDGELTDTKSAVDKLNNQLGNIYQDVSGGHLKASEISGTISATQAVMSAASGKVLFNGKGMWLRNTTDVTNDGLPGKTKGSYAVWMNEQGILFGKYTGDKASGKAGDVSYTDKNGWTWTTAINHEGVTAQNIAAGTLTGMTISGGSLNIGDGQFVVTSEGNLTAKSGTFKGTLEAAKIKGNLTPNGTGWLIGCGIKVGGTIENNNIAQPKFLVDSNGNVTMVGNIKLNGTISWGSTSQLPAEKVSGLSAVATSGKYSDLSGQPTYIKSTYISETSILSPNIYGGMFYATGQGADSGAAYYIYNGSPKTVKDDGTLGDSPASTYKKVGYISYDTKGANIDGEAQNRVLFTTLNNTALKINAAGNMSLQANGGMIYVHTSLHLGAALVGHENVLYGSTKPSNPQLGQVFFEI